MLNWLITWSLSHRFIVIAGALCFALIGALSLHRLEIDAFPDTTPVQVQINTVAPALSPEEVEQQITFPVEQAISGLPSLDQVRSVSKFGLSQVVVIFDDGIDIYLARQLIMERLSTVELPEGLPRPEMGPISTGLGEVFHYVVSGEGRNLTDLRTIHDWVIRPPMRTVKGTAEINSWGGYEKRYEVRLDPTLLVKYGLTFNDLVEALDGNNLNVGGGNIQESGAMLLVHGLGRTTNTEEIERIVVATKEGVPILVRDLARVVIGHEIRRGAVTANGKGEVVLGLGFMLMGENSHEVTWNLKKKLDDIKSTLPVGVKLETVYDRTELVDHVIDTVRKNLFEGGLLVIAVLFVFLGNLRAGLIVALAIPFSMLFAFSGMLRFGIAGSLLSLGALDFGLVVDSSVIMIENVVRRIAHGTDDDPRNHLEVIRDAAIEVRKPTMFGELIIMIVYLPILTLQGVEGKLFQPMAWTVIFALFGSMVLSLTLMPVLASLMLPRRLKERDPLLVRGARWIYSPILRLALRYRATTIGLTLAILAVTGMLARGLGSEFVPRLSEGAVVLNVVRLAGTDLSESIRYNTQMERALLAGFPDEIRHVWSRTGTAEVATDPMGVELSDIFVSLTPRDRWTKASSQAGLVALMQKEIRDFPGQNVAFTQPIEMRINEMISGVRSDVAVKLFGDDFDVLTAKARDIEAALRSVSGCADPSTEQVTGQPVLQIRVRQDQLARYGIPARDVLDLVESVGGKIVGEIFEGQLRFPLAVRLPDRFRETPDSIGAIELTTSRGERIPLSRIASVETVEGPSTITREWSQRRITVQCNVRGRDVGSFVAEAREKVAAIPLPRGRYRVEWGGQFENLERARTRLLIVVPIALGLIFSLLYLSLESVGLALLVFTGVPMALTGGVVALWLREMPLSVSAGIGFIALSGVAVLNGLVMVTFIRQLRMTGVSAEDAVIEGSLTRLRPVLMTALVASLGFVPMAFATGMGGEVQKPLASVVIGGIISSSALTLILLPVLYRWFEPPVGRLDETIDEDAS
jgi:heavy metal efflux system protein